MEASSSTMTVVAGGRERVRLSFDRLPTPIGELLIVCDNRALCAVDFDDFGERMYALLQRRYGSYEITGVNDPLGATARLDDYFRGHVAALDGLPVDPGGTPYQARVWRLLRTIPHGETRTYGELARQLGGTHARAVGQANALNPVAIVIPCHRVIGANAALTGYAGGIERKRWLLDHEARRRAPLLPLMERCGARLEATSSVRN